MFFFHTKVPSSSPESPKCDVLSSTSIYITWSPPPVDGQNGKIKGYKVSYISVDDLYGNFFNLNFFLGFVKKIISSHNRKRSPDS